MKICPNCKINKSLTEYYFRKTENRCQHYCKRCANDRQMEKWVKRKIEAVKSKGGKCSRCDYNKNYSALEFHHLDPKEKDFDWNKLQKMSIETIEKELKKSILLCANCHREIHHPNAILPN